jgi:ankyrin repeat protein
MEKTIIQKAKDEKLHPFMLVLISISMIPPNLTPSTGAEELFYKMIFKEDEANRSQTILLNALIPLIYELSPFWKTEIRKNFPYPQSNLLKKIFIGLRDDLTEDISFPFRDETITLKEFTDEALMEFFTVKYDPNIKNVLEDLYKTDDVEAFRSNVQDIFLSVKVRSFFSETVLHLAIEYRANRIATFLIEHDFPLEVVDNFGNTPLHNASYYGNAELFDLLIAHHAPIEKKNRAGLLPLEMTFFSEDFQFFNSVCERKLIKLENMLKENIIGRALRDDKVVVLKSLIEMKLVDPYKKIRRESSILSIAVNKRNLGFIKWMIEYHNCPVDYVLPDGYTLLNAAVFKGDFELMAYLIEKGADVNKLSKYNTSNLYLSISVDEYNKMSLYLIEHGAKFDLDRVNIAEAITTHKNSVLLKMMMDEVPNMNFIIKKRTTPLLNAIIRGDQELVDMLVEHVDIDFHNENKVPLLVQSISAGNFGLTKKFLQMDANPNQYRTQKKIRTYPIFSAITQGDVEILRMLVEKGANPNQIGFLGTTALMYAATLKKNWKVYDYMQTVSSKQPFWYGYNIRRILSIVGVILMAVAFGVVLFLYSI